LVIPLKHGLYFFICKGVRFLLQGDRACGDFEKIFYGVKFVLLNTELLIEQKGELVLDVKLP
jgi:hypothetical protein